MLKWVELSENAPDPRFLVLEKYLNANGIENSYSHSSLSLEHDLKNRIVELSGEHTQIRVNGLWRDRVKDAVDTWPATLLTLRSADALVCQNHIWWARNFLSEAIQILMAQRPNGIDLTGAALVMGATPEGRAVIHSLVRAGICRFLLSDRDEKLGRSLVEQLSQSYFNVTFEFLKPSMLTQLPAATTVAINTRDHQNFATDLAEMSYLNFLVRGGAWLDLSLGARTKSLEEESRTVGAQVLNGWLAWAKSDLLWLNQVHAGTPEQREALSVAHLAQEYETAYGSLAEP